MLDNFTSLDPVELWNMTGGLTRNYISYFPSVISQQQHWMSLYGSICCLHVNCMRVDSKSKQNLLSDVWFVWSVHAATLHRYLQIMTICSLSQCQPNVERVTEIPTVNTTGQSVSIDDEISARPPSVLTAGITITATASRERKKKDAMRWWKRRREWDDMPLSLGDMSFLHVEGHTRTSRHWKIKVHENTLTNAIPTIAWGVKSCQLIKMQWLKALCNTETQKHHNKVNHLCLEGDEVNKWLNIIK